MVLEAKNITFAYNDKCLLNEVNISFDKSQIYAIIGPNGAGKTTFLKILLSLLKPQSGNIFYDGKNLKSLSYLQKAKFFSYLPQMPFYSPEDRLWEVVKRGDYPHRRFPPPPRPLFIRKEIAEKYLELGNMWERKMSTLSGGEIQRGIIARVIIQDAPVMVFDEPLNHLDLFYRLKLFELFDKMRDEGKTIIYAVHDFNISLEYNHKIFLIQRGGSLRQLNSRKEEVNEILKKTYGVDFKTAKTDDKYYYIPYKRKE